MSKMVHALSAGEKVFINVWDSEMEDQVRKQLTEHHALNSNVEFYHHQAYEPWCRDHGPIFVKNKSKRAVINWKYNAWGDKYPPYDLDNRIPEQIANTRGIECFDGGMVLEGGSIEVNGTGTLITTESCLLNPNRNPELSHHQIEGQLCKMLGVSNIVWLEKGIVGDDTDGHIDDMTRFIDVNTVLTAVEEDAQDINYTSLKSNLDRLQKTNLNIIELPMPGPVRFRGQRLPASYANFYIGNSVVLLPVFHDLKDEAAVNILSRAFPGREIVAIDSTDLIWGQGSFHCLTQQEPD
jgi:agmatine deiminase